MASPKKRTSKTRKNLRKTRWKEQASKEAQKALATAKTILKNLSMQSIENTSP
jgi:ribosomal protein L32